ncbi:NAD(P)/FAD-dependent oxidoreductase [bacterium]|nr:NAD(P)/FAD-dependent oxidoreductase [bacterium]
MENKISNKISIVHRSNSFKALEKNVLKLEQNNIEQYLNYSLKDGNDYQLSLIHNENKDQEIIIEYDEIICMYGIEANNEHVEDLKVFDMKANKFITNRSQQTNIKNIYAIGQACIYENRANLIVVAQAEASNAIKAINNEDIKRKKELLKKDL